MTRPTHSKRRSLGKLWPTPFDLALWAALPMAQSSHIEARLKGILDTTRRRALTRPALTVLVALASGLAFTVATAYSPPSSLMAAITSGGYPSDTPAHVTANIAYFQAAIHRFGDKDPWAGKAYYVLGNAQMSAGREDDARASFDKAIALPEPPYPNSGIHSYARYERINVLDSPGHYAEAVTETQTLLRNGTRGLIAPDLRENLRERLPEFQFLANYDADRAAEKGQYRALVADPRWTQTLHHGVTVQLLGVMQSAGNVHTVWSPDGRLLSRARYKSLLGDHYATPGHARKVLLILHFSYPTGQAITTSYAMTGLSTTFADGLTRSNGVVLTNEEQINPETTAGRRTVEAWFPPAQRRTTLRVGVAVGPPDASLEQIGDDAKEWAEFPNVSLPGGQSSQTTR